MSPQEPAGEPGAWARYRKEVIVVLLFIAVPTLVYVGLSYNRSQLAGYYLLAGGQGSVAIERTVTGFKTSEFILPYSHTPATLTVHQRGTRIWMEGEYSAAPGSGTVAAMILYLRASAVRPGDFDLELYNVVSRGPKWFQRVWLWVKSLWKPRPATSVGPLLGFMHRVDDPDAIAYMELARKEGGVLMPGHSIAPTNGTMLFATSPNAPIMLANARRAAERHPDDLYLRILLLDALLRAGITTELTQKIADWKAEFERGAASDPFATAMFRLIEQKSRGLEALQEGKNAYGDLLAALAPDSDLQETVKAIERIKNAKALSTPGGVTYPSTQVINFLVAQVRVKVLGVSLWFRLLAGDVDGGMSIAVGRMRIGQVVEEFDIWIITRLIGIAIRSMAAADLIRFAGNAPLTLEQCDRLCSDLDRLNTYELPAELVNFYELGWPGELPAAARLSRANLMEVRTRYNMASTRFRLARTIAAARRMLIASGELPDMGKPGSLAPLLPSGLPTDVFSPTTSPLKAINHVSSQTLVVYSVGPDQTDDRAAWEYDATNGTVSTGDITAELRRVPKYPFAAGGTRAGTSATLVAQFPEGLPPDPFADTRGRGLSIVETTGSVLVYSYGPDTDQREVEDFKGAYVPAVSYDPTNGTVSKGDLVTTLSR
ncbi:MAG: hypothetical protein ACR2IE_15185 [Candidatus Sumerlaeaceae bacterium]